MMLYKRLLINNFRHRLHFEPISSLAWHSTFCTYSYKSSFGRGYMAAAVKPRWAYILTKLLLIQYFQADTAADAPGCYARNK
jgi:hypothetical protein